MVWFRISFGFFRSAENSFWTQVYAHELYDEAMLHDDVVNFFFFDLGLHAIWVIFVDMGLHAIWVNFCWYGATWYMSEFFSIWGYMLCVDVMFLYVMMKLYDVAWRNLNNFCGKPRSSLVRWDKIYIDDDWEIVVWGYDRVWHNLEINSCSDNY